MRKRTPCGVVFDNHAYFKFAVASFLLVNTYNFSNVYFYWTWLID